MEIEHNIKSLKKLFNKLVIPKINSLKDHTGAEIISVDVFEGDYEYKVYIELSLSKKLIDYNDDTYFYIGMSHIFLNTFKYVVPYGRLHLWYFTQEGKFIDDVEMEPYGYYSPDEEAIEKILKTKWK